MGPTENQLDFEQEVEDGWAVLVPAGTWRNVTNIGDEPLRLYAVYAPVHHSAGALQATADDARARRGVRCRRAAGVVRPAG
jgi:mannose-6-phosphate isomerase-like protein (cupin superfamily)